MTAWNGSTCSVPFRASGRRASSDGKVGTVGYLPMTVSCESLQRYCVTKDRRAVSGQVIFLPETCVAGWLFWPPRTSRAYDDVFEEGGGGGCKRRPFELPPVRGEHMGGSSSMPSTSTPDGRGISFPVHRPATPHMYISRPASTHPVRNSEGVSEPSLGLHDDGPVCSQR